MLRMLGLHSFIAESGVDTQVWVAVVAMCATLGAAAIAAWASVRGRRENQLALQPNGGSSIADKVNKGVDNSERALTLAASVEKSVEWLDSKTTTQHKETSEKLDQLFEAHAQTNAALLEHLTQATSQRLWCMERFDGLAKGE